MQQMRIQTLSHPKGRQTSGVSNHRKDWESMNAQSSMTPSEDNADIQKAEMEEINWKQQNCMLIDYKYNCEGSTG